MKTFIVNHYSHNILNNTTHLEFTINLNGEPKKIDQTFNNQISAQAFLYSNMRDYLLGILDDYVNHKKHIIESGNHPNQVKPLQICIDALDRFHRSRLSIETIADQFIKGFIWFEIILPAQQNPSYQSSLQNLIAIKNFCNTINNKKLPTNEHN